MSNVYTTRANFEIARNNRLNITLFGMWYRGDGTEFIVLTTDGRTKRFAQFNTALDYFECLTTEPEVNVVDLDVTPEEDEAFQALSTAPVSSF